MPLIFSIPEGATVTACLEGWPLRWLVAYILVTQIVSKIAVKLSGKVFNFPPQEQKSIEEKQKNPVVTNPQPTE